jgi:menaquinone-dependent protoporphyrinogen IX oxidase
MMGGKMQRRTFVNMAGMGTIAMATPVSFQYIPRTSNEKWAILFGTWCGTARDASIWISEGMGGIASVFDVRQSPDLSSFDHLVVGTAVHGNKGPKTLDDYIGSNLDKLSGKIRGLFAVCGALGKQPGAAQTKTIVDDYLAKLCRATSIPSRVFAGRITKGLLAEEDYKALDSMFKKLGQPFDDYDHLDRWECMEFGKEIHIQKKA